VGVQTLYIRAETKMVYTSGCSPRSNRWPVVEGETARDLSFSSATSLSGEGHNRHYNGARTWQGRDVGGRNFECTVRWRAREERGIMWGSAQVCPSRSTAEPVSNVVEVQVKSKTPVNSHITHHFHPSRTFLFRSSCHRLETSSFDCWYPTEILPFHSRVPSGTTVYHHVDFDFGMKVP